jgi:hypothetical protein
VLFFFELALFVLAMVTLALWEFVGRGLALGLWLAATAASLVGYALASRVLAKPRPPGAREGQAEQGQAERGTVPAKGAPLDARWAATLLYNWRRANALLVLGALAGGAWYWLA